MKIVIGNKVSGILQSLSHITTILHFPQEYAIIVQLHILEQNEEWFL